jgi:glucose dehydrogenase
MRPFISGLGASIAVLLVLSVYTQAQRESGQDFSGTKLTAPPTANWPTNGGNLYNQRYSPLKTITRDNVAQLKGVWRARLNGSGTAPQYSGFATPIVHEGVAYISTGANDVFALSLDGGEVLWQYEAKLDPNITSVCCGWNNKGVAVSDDKVFIGRLDGQLVALNRSTGKVAWSIQAERWQENFSITAPSMSGRQKDRPYDSLDGMVLIGFAGGDRGTRSRLKAFDAKDGRLIWTFYTIPGPGEPGHDTWPKDNDSWKYGGAAIWQTPAVDLDLGLVYFSTGNAAPDYNGAFRAGDNLYAASMLAIELKTGKYRWHFQAGASRHLGLRRRQPSRPDGCEHGWPHAQGHRRSGEDRICVHPRSRDGEAPRRHRREARAARTAAEDRGDPTLPARRLHRPAVHRDCARGARARERRPHLHAVRR